MRKEDRGVGLIEAVVVISIISVSFAAIFGAAVYFLRDGLYAVEKIQALFILDESVEVVRFIRDAGFATNITPLVGTGATYLTLDASGWNATSTNTQIFGKFSRTIELTEVYRLDSDDTIVPSTSSDPKTLDVGTVRLETVISWGSHTLENTTYVSDIYEN